VDEHRGCKAGLLSHSLVYVGKNVRKRTTEMNLTSILYAIGFTLGFCLCLFAGWDADGNAFRQAFLVFAGFCFGGMAVMVIENLGE